MSQCGTSRSRGEVITIARWVVNHHQFDATSTRLTSQITRTAVRSTVRTVRATLHHVWNIVTLGPSHMFFLPWSSMAVWNKSFYRQNHKIPRSFSTTSGSVRSHQSLFRVTVLDAYFILQQHESMSAWKVLLPSEPQTSHTVLVYHVCNNPFSLQTNTLELFHISSLPSSTAASSQEEVIRPSEPQTATLCVSHVWPHHVWNSLFSIHELALTSSLPQSSTPGFS